MSAHFRIERDTKDIAWLHMDTRGSGANVLSVEVLEAFDRELVSVAQSHPAGLVILSDKPSGFIAGADVKAFARITSADAVREHIERVHGILQRLESLAFPTVALIHGYCLGGGLELALACRYRVACGDDATRLGFPEIKLGIFPGYGGTVRATRTVGHLKAMELMLSGRSVSGRAASRIGLVDITVPERQLRNAARRLIGERPHPRRPGILQKLPGAAPLRPFVGSLLRRQIAKKAPAEHFPAPYTLIAHWRRHAGDVNAMYRSEAEEISRLIRSETARNLIRVFLLQERLKSEGDKAAFRPRQVHVVGGGVMGGDIAAWCVLHGLRVSLQDREPMFVAGALVRARALFRHRLRDPYQVQQAVDRLIPDHAGHGAARADVVIEAIFEDAGTKQELYGQLEPRLRPESVLASNTSSIPLETLGASLQRPERLVGLHFFNPVAKMPLVEVIGHAGTDPEMLRRAAAFTRHIDKLPLPVKSSPGFLVNRVLMPYLLEAVQLLDEGVPGPLIDQAAVSFGMPLGPIELADRVGLDVCLAVAERMVEALGDEVPGHLRDLVEAGNLGRKTGQGFYVWRKDRPDKPKLEKGPQPLEELTDRLILRLVNEAVGCLREGIVADEDLLDAGVIFGTGFAPFRGGPLRYAHSRGSTLLRNRLRELETHHGSHFHADDGWAALI